MFYSKLLGKGVRVHRGYRHILPVGGVEHERINPITEYRNVLFVDHKQIIP
jgi:hypothetical protein